MLADVRLTMVEYLKVLVITWMQPWKCCYSLQEWKLFGHSWSLAAQARECPLVEVAEIESAGAVDVTLAVSVCWLQRGPNCPHVSDCGSPVIMLASLIVLDLLHLCLLNLP